MKFLYLDKKERILAWFTPKNSTVATVVTAVILALPIWPDSVSGKFVLEPAQMAVIRARVPGTLMRLMADEGQRVAAGQPLAVLHNPTLTSDYDDARARLVLASDHVNTAAVHFQSREYGAALKEKDQLNERVHQLSQEHDALQVASPISGTIISPRVQDLVGTFVTPGRQILEVADLTTLRARIYVPEYELYKIRAGEDARLRVDGFFHQWKARTQMIASSPSEMESGLGGSPALSGLNPPHYYLVELLVSNPEFTLRPGMTGLARIYAGRHSLAGMGWEAFSNFWGRKLW